MAINSYILILTLILTLGLTSGADAQTRRRKIKSHRTPTMTTAQQSPPQIVPVQTTLEPEVVSRAEDDLNAENSAATDKNNSVNSDLQKTPTARPVKTLVAPINKNNAAEERESRSLIDLERLSLAEGRAEAFRKQLSDVIERESALRSKIDQLDYQMRPEVIQGETAVIGSLRPEEVRDSRRKMLENEKSRANDQLNTVMTSRIRLDSAILNADALVDKLRARVEAEINEDTRKPSESGSVREEPQIPDN